MAYTFDGSLKIISFDTSTTAFDVRDLWSRWNDWLLISDNSKYEQAMRVVGGDLLPGSKELGLTYFLLNGWKIKPFEETHVLNVNGNIYSEDGSSPFMPVYGAYNITIINTVSNLVDSTVQQLPEIEYASYSGGITIDSINGTDSATYPVGTPLYPCKTLLNISNIARERGLKKIYVLSGLSIVGVPRGILENYEFIGTSKASVDITITGVQCINCTFDNSTVSGTFDSDSTVNFYNCNLTDLINVDFNANNCYINNLTNVSTELSMCTLEGNIVVSASGVFSGIEIVFEGDFTTIDLSNPSTLVSLDVNSGIVTFDNAHDGSLIELNIRGGEVQLNSSCDGGDFYIEGYGKLYNDSTMTIKGNNLISTEAITASVWDEPMLDHVDTGTTGKALSTASSGGVDVNILATAVWTSASRTLTDFTSASSIAVAVWEKDLETSFSAEEILRLLASVLAGVTSGADTTTMKFRDLNNTKDRIVAILDGIGNRTAVTKDVS